MVDRLRLATAVALLAAVTAIGARGASDAGARELRTGGDVDWSDYLGGADSAQFSPLADIRPDNVATLEVAWRHALPGNGQSNGNPLVIAGRMYVPWSGGVTALDAASGRELWTATAPGLRMRGLSSWVAADGARRIFYSRSNRLYAINAADGRPIVDFGEGGSIDLRQGLDRDPATIGRIESQSPGRIFGDLIILGTTGGFEWNGPPGYIRAFDVRSGRLVWTFHTIPHRGEAGYDSWPEDAYKKVGGVNNWSEMTLDAANGLLFVPLGSAHYNFYGVNRTGGNLFANSLVALDARTGRRVWHFQTVHHDLWDYDLPQAPKLLTLNRGGRRVEAVAVAGKTGYIYTFERKTGRPIFPIVERPVPQSDVPGERTSPTQPIPAAPEPFVPTRMTAADLSPFLPADERAALAATLSGLRNEGIFTPPSIRGSLQIPGSSGGSSWGDGVADRRRGLFYVVGMNIPAILRLEPPSKKTSTMFLGAEPVSPGRSVYLQNCAACHGATRAGQPPAIPSLIGVADRRSEAEVRAIVTLGRGPMPGFRLAPDAMTSLLSYLGFKEAAPAPNATAAGHPAPAAQPGAIDAGPIKLKSGYNFLFSKAMLPAVTIPWSTLTAYDMNSGRKMWQVPFGELPGMPGSGTLFPRGTIAATASGLIFAGTQDRRLRAWDVRQGRMVWSTPLPSVPGGVPAIYRVRGRQFVALAAASYDPGLATMSPMMTPGTNSIVAFALREPRQAGKR